MTKEALSSVPQPGTSRGGGNSSAKGTAFKLNGNLLPGLSSLGYAGRMERPPKSGEAFITFGEPERDTITVIDGTPI